LARIFEAVGGVESEAAVTRAVLLSLSGGDLACVFRPLRPGKQLAEEWTVRKVVRRMISRRRVHAAEILQRRTWVLLGTPRAGT
jgi:hypothetical protein